MKIFLSNRNLSFLAVAIVIVAAIAASFAQQKPAKDETKSHEDCPMMKKHDAQASASPGKEHSDHYEKVLKDGETAMGFSQTATTHHFLIRKDGGAIQVEANDPKVLENRNKIRTHLAEIARQFKNGIFTTPFAVHGQVPPGVPVMDDLKNKIDYTYKETDKGAEVTISTTDPRALAAIHEFLKFQITDHRTGDPIDHKE